MRYVLITAARNEEALIEHTLRSVTMQTVLPERWIVVDDGSTDGTASMVRRFSDRYPWIELVSHPPRRDRSFAGKAHAVNGAFERLQSVPFDIVGNLDGDVSFEPGYMAFLIEQFAADPRLGVAGTPFTEVGDYDSARDSFEGDQYVAGPFQLFRGECFREIGGYVPNAAGGVDWIAVMTARMRGWTVRAFPQKRFHHHRSMGTAQRGVVSALFSYGEKDYYLGGSPVWQVFRVTYRMAKRPYVIGGLALLAGYAWAALRRVPRPVSAELMAFHRQDQMRKLKAILRRVLRLRTVDPFAVDAGRAGHR
jgi:glycosyltransferase involved in cell wall biosynthesis